MKVFWLFLFGICALPLASPAPFVKCRKGFSHVDTTDVNDFCMIKIYDNDTSCIVEYGVVNKNDLAPESAWEGRGCEKLKEGMVYCYCEENFCNDDIVDFQVELRDAAAMTTDDTSLEKMSNCLLKTNPSCAVGTPESMTLQKRRSRHFCVITLRKGQDSYEVVNLEQLGQRMDLSPSCVDYGDVISCYCLDHQCNINKHTFIEDSDLVGGQNSATLGSLAATDITSFASHVRTCGDSLVAFDPNGTQRCAKVFKKNQNAACDMDFALITNDQKRGCFVSQSEYDNNAVTCLCESDKCEVKKLLAASNMRLDGDGCVQVLPTTAPSTHSTSTTTTTTSATTTSATTTSPEQLTCWSSDISTVTKDKSNSVCFIDYAMINSKCELRGRGIDHERNATAGCRFIVNQSKGVDMLRCTCVENRCNNQLLDGIWKMAESNNSEHVKLIECAERLVNGGTLPTSGTSNAAPSPPPPSQTEDTKSASFFGLFIGSIAFVVLLLVTVLTLIITIVRMKKKGDEAKQGTGKNEQKAPKTPTAIQIENPVVNKDSATVPPPAAATKKPKEVNQREEEIEKTTATGTGDLDSTGSTTDSDSTGTGPSEVRVTVRGFNRN